MLFLISGLLLGHFPQFLPNGVDTLVARRGSALNDDAEAPVHRLLL
jgi:hypothetical protein